jgi:uncharacterized OB-fold protein
MSSPRYWREMPQRYRLEAGKCKACGMVWYPPRDLCPGCRSRLWEKTELPRTGKLLAHTVIRVPPSQFADQAPYPLAVVELEGGAKILVQIADASPEELESGQEVRLELRRIQDEGKAGIICYGHKAVLARE